MFLRGLGRWPVLSGMSRNLIWQILNSPILLSVPLARRSVNHPIGKVSLYDLHSAMDEGVKVRRRYSGEGRRSVLEAGSSQIRLAPSPGVQQGSNGIQGRAGGRSLRMYKGVNTAVDTPERNRRKDHRCWWRGSISGRSRITL